MSNDNYGAMTTAELKQAQYDLEMEITGYKLTGDTAALPGARGRLTAVTAILANRADRHTPHEVEVRNSPAETRGRNPK